MQIVHIALIGAWAVAVGCESPSLRRLDAGQQPTGVVVPTTKVENGVVVAQHAPNAFGRALPLTIDAKPIAVMGGSDGRADYDLTRVSAVIALPDVRYAAFRRIDPRIFIFGADGAPERTIGRLGQGPGDFMRPSGFLLVGHDTLYVPDEANARVNWIQPDHGFVRTSVMSSGAFSMEARGLISRDKVLWVKGGWGDYVTKDSLFRIPFAIAISGMTRDGFRIVDSVPGVEMVRIMSNYRNRPRPILVHLRLGGIAAVAAWDSVIAVITGVHGYEIEQRATDGRIVGRVRVPVSRRPVTAAMRAAVVADELAQIAGPNSERMVDAEESRRQARENPFTDSLPPYQSLFVTKGKILWVTDAIAPTDSGWNATAFRRDGAIVGRLYVVGRSTPLLIDDDRLVLRTEDENGVISLRVHRIIRTR